MDQVFPNGDFDAHGIETLYEGWKAGLLSPAQEDMTRLWLVNELDEFDPAEQLIMTTRQRQQPFIDRAVELAHALLGPEFGDALGARFNATYAQLDNVHVGQGSPYSKWGTLRDDVSPKLRAIVASMRKYNQDLRPHHSEYFFTRSVGKLYSDEIVAMWHGYWRQFDCMCCDEGGPCPDNVAYYYGAGRGAPPCADADTRGYGASGSPVPTRRRTGSASATPTASGAPTASRTPPAPVAAATEAAAAAPGGEDALEDNDDSSNSHGQAAPTGLGVADDDDDGAESEDAAGSGADPDVAPGRATVAPSRAPTMS